jgi:hypothetical protein
LKFFRADGMRPARERIVACAVTDDDSFFPALVRAPPNGDAAHAGK